MQNVEPIEREVSIYSETILIYKTNARIHTFIEKRYNE